MSWRSCYSAAHMSQIRILAATVYSLKNKMKAKIYKHARSNIAE